MEKTDPKSVENSVLLSPGLIAVAHEGKAWIEVCTMDFDRNVHVHKVALTREVFDQLVALREFLDSA